MSVVLQQRFNAVLNTLDDREYLLAKVACEVAPVFQGIKPASLMSFGVYARNLGQLWEKYRQEVCPVLQLQYFEMKKTEKYTLVLFYHPAGLEKVLTGSESKALLNRLGYGSGVTLTEVLYILRAKFEHLFPHEIGLLLGIPPEDVSGFIANKGSDCLFCGYWKVYHNPGRAVDLFQMYDKAKSKVMWLICNMKKPKSASTQEMVV